MLAVKLTAPSEVMEVPAKVKLPAVAFKVTTPVPVVVTGLLIVTIWLVRLRPNAPVVFTAPPMVVVPVPAV